MKIAVVMSYYERFPQLMRTLETIRQTSVKDYQIVIVDDASPSPLAMRGDDLHVIRIEPEQKTWRCQDPATNTGIKYALDVCNAEIIIIQNPECFHVGDVLKYAAENTTEKDYITFAALNITKEQTFNPETDIQLLIRSTTAPRTETMWYNHPLHRPCYYEFCAAIHRNNLIRMNGYDERFAEGIAFNDDYFFHRIKLMGLQLQIIPTPMVVHQWHDRSYRAKDEGKYVLRNRDLWEQLKRRNEIRAVHTITPDF